MEVHGFLGIEPKFRGGSKRGGELERHLRGHRGAAVHDSINYLDVAGDMIGKLLLRHSQRQQELLMKNLPRSRRWSSPSHQSHDGCSVVVADVHIGGTEVAPAKDDPPWVVDADAVETREVSLQRLQSVAGRRGQIAKRLRIVEHVELPRGDPGDAGPTRCPGKPALEKESVDLPAGETLDRHSASLYHMQVYRNKVFVPGIERKFVVCSADLVPFQGPRPWA